MTYRHRQYGRVHWILILSGLFMLPFPWLLALPVAVHFAIFIPIVLILFLALCFGYLQVRDDGEYLALRYGPIPLFFKRFPYAGMVGVAPARSSLSDGWGIHWSPGKGWIYNLWGRDCVAIEMHGKTVRIGTDDPAGLVAFLQAKLGPAGAS